VRSAGVVGALEPALIGPELALHELGGGDGGVAVAVHAERGAGVGERRDHQRVPARDPLVVEPRPHAPLARRKDLEDTPIPSGGSAAAFGLLRLARLTGDARYEDAAVGHARLLHTLAAEHPTAFGHLLQVIDFLLADVREIALVGDDRGALEQVVRETFRPHVVLAGGADGVPLLEGRDPVGGRAAAYVCERFTCQRPVTEPDDLRALLNYDA
jgi:uncharacterized protein YyaL (SSP411 family)